MFCAYLRTINSITTKISDYLWIVVPGDFGSAASFYYLGFLLEILPIYQNITFRVPFLSQTTLHSLLSPDEMIPTYAACVCVRECMYDVCESVFQFCVLRLLCCYYYAIEWCRPNRTHISACAALHTTLQPHHSDDRFKEQTASNREWEREKGLLLHFLILHVAAAVVVVVVVVVRG